MVGVDAAISKERPIAARVFALCGIAFDHENFLVLTASLRDDLAERIGDKRIPPEFDARIARGRITFIADAIDDGHKGAVGDGVRALNRPPGVELRLTYFGLFLRVPADAGWIKNDLGAIESG